MTNYLNRLKIDFYEPKQEINYKQLSKELSHLINTALNSIQIKKLTLQENEKDITIRPNFNVFLRMPIGAGKSTILNEVSDIVNSKVITGITRAGLVGTIDKTTQQYISGYAWECRNNLGLFDEMNFGRKRDGQEEFLQLLETGTYGKRFGLYSASSNLEEGDLYFKVDKGKIDLKTRFSAIIASMKRIEWERGQYFRALMSRCEPYNCCPAIDALKEIANGKQFYKIERLNLKSEIVIPNKIYNKIHNYIYENLKKIYFKNDSDNKNAEHGNELYLRSIGDICRDYAVWGNLDLMDMLLKWKIETHDLIGIYFKNDYKTKVQEAIEN